MERIYRQAEIINFRFGRCTESAGQLFGAVAATIRLTDHGPTMFWQSASQMHNTPSRPSAGANGIWPSITFDGCCGYRDAHHQYKLASDDRKPIPRLDDASRQVVQGD
jgi:hypothetical protein